jgi:predicted NBD/HSP70 family sugar kinase
MRKRRPEIAHVRDVVTLALSGDLSARRHLRDSGRHLGTVLAAVVTLLNPAVLVIGGDIAPAYDIFVAGLREALYRDASALATRDLDIVAATHGAQAGVRGCAVLALDHVLTAAVIDRQHALA